MNKFIARLTFFACFCSFAYAEELSEMDRIHDLAAALQKGGLPELLNIARPHQWQAPRMPSKWSVEHRPGRTNRGRLILPAESSGENWLFNWMPLRPYFKTSLQGTN